MKPIVLRQRDIYILNIRARPRAKQTADLSESVRFAAMNISLRQKRQRDTNMQRKSSARQLAKRTAKEDFIAKSAAMNISKPFPHSGIRLNCSATKNAAIKKSVCIVAQRAARKKKKKSRIYTAA